MINKVYSRSSAFIN